MIDEYFKKHPKEKHIMEHDWHDFAINIQGYREEQMPEPCKSFVYGWIVAAKRANINIDRAYDKYAELLSSNQDISMEGYSKLLEDFWREG